MLLVRNDCTNKIESQNSCRSLFHQATHSLVALSSADLSQQVGLHWHLLAGMETSYWPTQAAGSCCTACRVNTVPLWGWNVLRRTAPSLFLPCRAWWVTRMLSWVMCSRTGWGSAYSSLWWSCESSSRVQYSVMWFLKWAVGWMHPNQNMTFCFWIKIIFDIHNA